MEPLTEPDTKRPQKTDIEEALMQTHDWINDKVSLHMVDNSKGPNIFLQAPTGSQYSSGTTTTTEKAMDMKY